MTLQQKKEKLIYWIQGIGDEDIINPLFNFVDEYMKRKESNHLYTYKETTTKLEEATEVYESLDADIMDNTGFARLPYN